MSIKELTNFECKKATKNSVQHHIVNDNNADSLSCEPSSYSPITEVFLVNHLHVSHTQTHTLTPNAPQVNIRLEPPLQYLTHIHIHHSFISHLNMNMFSRSSRKKSCSISDHMTFCLSLTLHPQIVFTAIVPLIRRLGRTDTSEAQRRSINYDSSIL